MVTFSLETASCYVRDLQANNYGFKCLVVGFDNPALVSFNRTQWSATIHYLPKVTYLIHNLNFPPLISSSNHTISHWIGWNANWPIWVVHAVRRWSKRNWYYRATIRPTTSPWSMMCWKSTLACCQRVWSHPNHYWQSARHSIPIYQTGTIAIN